MKKAEVLGFVAGIALIGVAAGAYFVLQGGDAKPQVTEQAPASTPKLPAAKPVPEVPAVEQPPRTNLTPSPVQPTEETNEDSRTTLMMTRVAGQQAIYTPGETVDISLSLEKAGPDEIRALGIQEELPPGWSFVELIGAEQPGVQRVDISTGKTVLEMAWIQIPAFPFSFAYRLRAPADATGVQTLRGEALYRMAGPEYRTGISLTDLQPSGASAPASPSPTPEAAAAQITTPAGIPAPIVIAPEAATPQTPTAPAAQTPTTPAVTPAAAPAPVQGEAGVLAFYRSAEPYTPGQPVTVTLDIDYAGGGPIAVLSLLEEFPADWKLVTPPPSNMENMPRTANYDERTGRLSMIWGKEPQWPVRFTYQLMPPDGTTGTVQIRGGAVYRTGTMANETGQLVTELTPAQ